MKMNYLAKIQIQDTRCDDMNVTGKWLWKNVIRVTAFLGIFAIGAIGVEKEALADDPTIRVTMEINAMTGEVVNVLNSTGRPAEEHERGKPGNNHGQHIGKPLPPVVLILGLDGTESGGHMPCPSGFTHIIIGAKHYCIQ